MRFITKKFNIKKLNNVLKKLDCNMPIDKIYSNLNQNEIKIAIT